MYHLAPRCNTMPTVNPRVNVTLSPSLDALVSSMASHQRVSKAQVLRELLEAAEPALQRAVALMDAAKQAAGELKASLVQSLEAEQRRAEKEYSRSLRGMESLSSDLVAQAEAIRARRPARSGARPAVGRSPAASDPPLSKRGVKSPSEGPSRSPSRGRSKGGKS